MNQVVKSKGGSLEVSVFVLFLVFGFLFCFLGVFFNSTNSRYEERSKIRKSPQKKKNYGNRMIKRNKEIKNTNTSLFVFSRFFFF